MTSTMTEAMRVTMAETFAQYVARQSLGCHATATYAVEFAGQKRALIELRCVLASHEGSRHETLSLDGNHTPFEATP